MISAVRYVAVCVRSCAMGLGEFTACPSEVNIILTAGEVR